MRSASVDDAERESATQSGVVYRLLDPAFGFFVWIAHLILIYTVAAVSCGLGLASAAPRQQSLLVITLAAITLVAAAAVVGHGIRRYGQQAEMRDRGFLIRIAVAHDAVATLAILWQLVPILMAPVCR
jgi:hypothetical protein